MPEPKQVFGVFTSLAKKAPDLRFNNREDEVFRIQFEPELKVILADGVEWDAAARTFWNTVHRVMGHPLPFPDA